MFRSYASPVVLPCSIHRTAHCQVLPPLLPSLPPQQQHQLLPQQHLSSSLSSSISNSLGKALVRVLDEAIAIAVVAIVVPVATVAMVLRVVPLPKVPPLKELLQNSTRSIRDNPLLQNARRPLLRLRRSQQQTRSLLWHKLSKTS